METTLSNTMPWGRSHLRSNSLLDGRSSTHSTRAARRGVLASAGTAATQASMSALSEARRKASALCRVNQRSAGGSCSSAGMAVGLTAPCTMTGTTATP